MRPPAARAAMDRISHAVGFDTTPIETALTLLTSGPASARKLFIKGEICDLRLGAFA